MNAATGAQEKAAILMAPPKIVRAQHADEDAALSDMDTFADWLSSGCIYKTSVSSTDIGYQCLMPGEHFDERLMQQRLDIATVAQLQHVMLNTTYERRAWLALRELKARYLAAQGFA